MLCYDTHALAFLHVKRTLLLVAISGTWRGSLGVLVYTEAPELVAIAMYTLLQARLGRLQIPGQ